MRYLLVLTQISTIEAAWKDKWQNKIKPGFSSESRIDFERTCEREIQSLIASDAILIENGHFGDCEGLNNTGADVKCFAVCDEGLVGNWKKKAPEIFVRCKSENADDLKFKQKVSVRRRQI